MKLRFWFALFAVIGMVISTACMIVSVSLATSHEFLQIERELAGRDLGRVMAEIGHEQTKITNTTRDYARWDPIWNFLNQRNPRFLEAEMSAGGLGNLGIQLMVLSDSRGKMLYQWQAGPNSQTGDGQPVVDSASLASLGPTGILAIGTSDYLVSILPVSRSDGSGKTEARLLLGTRLDGNFLASLTERTRVKTTIFRTNPAQPDDWTQRLGTSPRVIFVPEKGNSIEGLGLLPYIQGPARLIVHTSTERQLSAELPRIYTVVSLVSGIAAVALVALLWLTFSRRVTLPLGRLARILDAMDIGAYRPADSSILNELGKSGNEIGSIARGFLDLGQRLQTSHEALLAANSSLEKQVAQRTEDLLSANHELTRYAKILSDTSEGVVVTELDGRILEVNDALVRMSGFSREELLGANPRTMKSNRHEADFYQAMWQEILENGRWSGEIWDRRKDGELYPKWLSITTLFDDQGKAINYVGLSSDISRIKEAESRLNQLAYYDSLTDLPNRYLFKDRLTQAINRAQRGGNRMALLYMDLDRFKLVNDTLGHTAGDQLLIQVGQRLGHCIRESDTVCRLGGDEFTAILENIIRSEDVAEISRKIVSRIAEPFFLADQETFIGISIGIALFPYDGRDSAALIQKADEAMYKSKESGRGQWRFASGQINQESRRRLETEAGLRYAIAREELVLHYQAQFSAPALSPDQPGNPAALVGAEALVRWNHQGKLVSPGSFIDIAEESDLICQIGAWVLHSACLEARNWVDAGHPLTISVNVSARQFAAGDLPAIVAETLARTGLDPRWLKLEITESYFMKNIDFMVRTMAEIRKTGVSFSVDDFGVGFSSLQYLSRLPLDGLKIDKSFVDGLGSSLQQTEMVEAVVSLAKSFHLVSVAEGVETPEQLLQLQAIGCDQIQGYYSGKPMPAEQFRRMALFD